VPAVVGIKEQAVSNGGQIGRICRCGAGIKVEDQARSLSGAVAAPELGAMFPSSARK